MPATASEPAHTRSPTTPPHHPTAPPPPPHPIQSTPGYGDIVPATVTETALVLLFQIVGVMFFGLLLNSITGILTATGPQARRVEAVKQKLQVIECVCATKVEGCRVKGCGGAWFGCSDAACAASGSCQAEAAGEGWKLQVEGCSRDV